MAGGTQKTKTENKPWEGTAGSLSNANEWLMNGFAQSLWNGAPQSSPFTGYSMDYLNNEVSKPNSTLNNALGLANKTVSGGFLGANPYVTQAYQGAADDATRAYSSAVQPAMRQYQSQMDSNLSNWKNAISPGIDAQFAAGGRMGSGLYANARNEGETNVARQFADAQSNQAQYLADANNALARNLTNTAGQMYYQNYGDERARQNAAMTAAPQLATLPAGILQQIGAQQEQQGSDRQNWMYNLSKDYAQAASGLNGGGYGVQTSKQPGQNPWLQALGMGLNGLQTYAGMGGFK